MLTRHDNELGDIEFVRSKRATRINVRILKDRLKVSLPLHSTEEEAMKFIYSVKGKIIAKQQKIKDSTREKSLILDENSRLETATFTVVLEAAERKNIFFSIRDNILKIEFPAGIDCTNEKIQQQFWNGISHFLKKEAKRLLPERINVLAEKYGFSYSSVKVQSSKTRWGSCSQGKSINLSFYLMLLPWHLIDYVILHELCHTKEMNHSDKFWAWMDKVTDNSSKKLRAELKKYPIPKF
ncbi:M48 family metallopeptidase [Paludibacteraceae bacterium OttesenSCG-928-F17]|nr:M48 family metallopeptidase [Paludibacteraceae bacterium OttesenSCG-928-F17]